MDTVLRVRVVPGTLPAPRLGQLVNLSSNTNLDGPLVFANGLNEDYVNANTSDKIIKAASSDDRYTNSATEKAMTITGGLDVNFDMAKVVSISGSANLNYGDSSSKEKLSRVFSMWSIDKQANLELQNLSDDIDSDLAGVTPEAYTRIVTEIVYGKSATGNIEITRLEKKTNLNASGELTVKLAAVPIGGNGKLEYESSEDDKNFSVIASLQCIGSNAGGIMASMEDFVEELQNHIDEKAVDVGIISYVLTPLAQVPKLEGCRIKNSISSFRKMQLTKRVFEMTCLETALGRVNVPPEIYLTDTKEKRDYGRARIDAAVYVRSFLAKAASFQTNEDIVKILNDTEYMTIENWQYSDADSKLGNFAALFAKALAKNPAGTPIIKNKSIILTAIPGKGNYANCDGTYTVLDDSVKLNGKSVYINSQKNRFIGWGGEVWTLTAIEYYDRILSMEIASPFGGFHFGSGTELLQTKWKAYTVSA